jgi:hypothetical protein
MEELKQLRIWLRDFAIIRLLGFLCAVTLGGAIVACTFISTRIFEPSRLISWRYALPPIAATVGAMLWGARYVQDVFELGSYTRSFRFLVAAMFGIWHSTLVIEEGRKKVKPGEENLLEVVGGPGYILIRPGSVVVTEGIHGFSHVRNTGRYYLPRFEHVQEIIGLEEQAGEIESIKTMTGDCIQVKINNVHYHYRLRPSEQISNYSESMRVGYNPYEEAAHHMAYGRRVLAEGGLNSWLKTLNFVVDSEITNWINDHTLDELTAPQRNRGTWTENPLDPRSAIGDRLMSESVQNRFKVFGAELRWVDIGRFEALDPAVAEQRLKTWQSQLLSEANRVRVEGEAERIYQEEIGRAEAQIHVLNTILQLFRDPVLGQTADEKILNVLLSNIISLLDRTNRGGKGEGRSRQSGGQSSS